MINDPRFEREVLAAFAFLASGTGSRLMYSESDPAAFGNAQMGVEYEEIRLRVTRDRDQIFVELSPRAVVADWFDEDVVVELVAGREAAARLEANTARPLTEAASAIQVNLPAILERFRAVTWPGTRTALKALQNERAQRLFG